MRNAQTTRRRDYKTTGLKVSGQWSRSQSSRSRPSRSQWSLLSSSVVLWSVVCLLASPAFAQWAPRREIDPNKPILQQLPKNQREDLRGLLPPIRQSPDAKALIPQVPAVAPVQVSVPSALPLGATGPGGELPAVAPVRVSVSPVVAAGVAAAGGGPAPALSAVEQQGSLYLSRLQAGDPSPEAVQWLNSLSRADILSRLEKLSLYDKEQASFADLLVAVLTEKHGVTPKSLNGLTDKVVYFVGEYYRRLRDERCVGVYQHLLGKRTSKAHGMVPELLRLGEFYVRAGELQKAEDTFLRAEQYSDDSRFLANCTLEAARTWLHAGDEKRANDLYEKVPQYGYGWATGIALYDRAWALARKGKHEEARKLLTVRISGQYADQVGVVLSSYLGSLYYATGNLEEAKNTFQEAVNRFKRLEAPLSGEGLESCARNAESGMVAVEQWRQKPIQVLRGKVELRISGSEANTWGQIGIRTPFEFPLDVAVTPSVLDTKLSKDVRQGQWFVERVLAIRFSELPSVGDRSCATVSISSASFPNYRVEVPVELRHERDLDISRPTLFLGLMKPGQNLREIVKVSSREPFKVESIQTQSGNIRAERATGLDDRTADVIVSVSTVGIEKGTLVEGVLEILLSFSAGRKEVVRLPYCGYVE